MNQLKPAPTPFLLSPQDFPSPYADFTLRVQEKNVVVSAPLPGDGTLTANDSADSPWITLGVAAAALSSLHGLIGQQASVFTSRGRRVCGLRLEKVDPRLNVVVGRRAP